MCRSAHDELAQRMVNGQSWGHCRRSTHTQQTFGHLLFKLNDKTICSIFGAEVLDTLAGYYLCVHDIYINRYTVSVASESNSVLIRYQFTS